MNDTVSNTSDWLLGAMKKNPEGLLLLAAGAALLLRKSGALAPSNGRPRQGSGTSGISKAVSGAQEFASNVADRASETVSSVASSATDFAGKAGRAVGEQSGRVAQQAQSTFQGTVNRILQDQPLAIAIAGIAAGAAIAATFPATEFEKEHLGPLGDEVSHAAQRVGGQLKDATSKAGEALKNAADQRGLNTDGLKEVASELAGAFSSTITGAAESPNGGEPRPRGPGERKSGPSHG